MEGLGLSGVERIEFGGRRRAEEICGEGGGGEKMGRWEEKMGRWEERERKRRRCQLRVTKQEVLKGRPGLKG